MKIGDEFDLIQFLTENLRPGDSVIVTRSRGRRLEVRVARETKVSIDIEETNGGAKL